METKEFTTTQKKRFANKTKVTIQYIDDIGRGQDIYCDSILMLRKARRAGDSEIVNNYVLGVLREAAKYGTIAFTEEKIYQ